MEAFRRRVTGCLPAMGIYKVLFGRVGLHLPEDRLP